MIVYLSTLVPGLARAERPPGGEWNVEVVAPNADIRCLAADPHAPGTVFAGTQGGGVLRSDNAGHTFQPAGLDGLVVKSLAVHPARPGLIYAGTKPPHLFVSADRGGHWDELVGFQRVRRFFWFSPSERPFTPYVQGIAVSTADPDVVIAGIEYGAVVRRADGGRTWQGHRPRALRDCHSLNATGGRFFEGGDRGGAVSDDGGVTWSRPTGLKVSPAVLSALDTLPAYSFSASQRLCHRRELAVPVPDSPFEMREVPHDEIVSAAARAFDAT